MECPECGKQQPNLYAPWCCRAHWVSANAFRVFERVQFGILRWH